MKYFYTIKRRGHEREHYNHVDVSIYSDTSERKELMGLTWQGDQDSEYWYAFRLELSANSPGQAIDQLKVATRIANLLHNPANFNEDDPLQVVRVLEENKIHRMIWDNRVSEFVQPDKVLSLDYYRYMACVEGQCIVDCVAMDADRTSKLLVKKFAEYADSSWYIDKLTQWIQEGKQVCIDRNAEAPDVRSIEDICKPMKEKQPEAIAA